MPNEIDHAALAEMNARAVDAWRNAASKVIKILHRTHSRDDSIPWTVCRTPECREARGHLAVAYEAARETKC